MNIKEMNIRKIAFVALALAIVGTIAMIISAYYAAVHSDTDCTDDKYYQTSDGVERCLDENAALLRLSIFLSDIGYPILLLGLVLMLGSNRLQDK